jgi:hypothetical protein
MSIQLFFKRNASTILTCVGAVGVVATSVMAVKATPKAMQLLEAAKEEKGEELTKLEKVKTAGPAYIPTAVTGAATIACIFSAQILNKRQQAALTSAYALLNQSYKEYKDKVDELYGEEAGEKVRAEIAKDKYEETEIEVHDDKQLFFDFFSGRYFESTLEQVQWAEYEINRSVAVNGGACVNEFYDYLGLEELPEYEMLGWSDAQMYEMYWHTWIEFEHEAVPIDDDDETRAGLECTIIHMPLEPFPGYLDY